MTAITMAMNRTARRYLIIFSLLASLVLTGCVLFLSSGSLIYPLSIGCISVGCIYYYTKPKRHYVLPVIWSLFFILGYVLAFASVLVAPENAGVGVIKDPTLFAFTDDSFFPIFLAMLSGIAGMALATEIFERLIGHNPGRILTSLEVLGTSRSRLRTFATHWLLLSVAIIGAMWAWGIGRTGLPHATELPFKLAGILVYVKNMVIPFLGFLVFVACERTRDYRLTQSAFWLLLSVGAVGSVAFLSRGFFIIMVMPALLYALCYGQDAAISRRIFWKSGLVVLVIMLVIMPLIDALRMAMYAGITVASLDLANLAKAAPSVLEAFGNVVHLASARIIGFRELVAISSSDQFDLWGPWLAFIGDQIYTDRLSLDLFGLERDESVETAFGYGFGLWGMFFLSGSYLVVFLGAMVATSVVLAFEELFLRHGYAPLNLFMAVSIGLWVWGGIDFFLLSRLLAAALFCYAVVRYSRLSAFLRRRY